MKTLKGITWDHPRGYQPLRAAVPLWKKTAAVGDLVWDVRSLKDFGDYPIEKLCEKYDLLLVDHPFMGEAALTNILLPLDKHLSEEFIKKQEQESIGKSFQSYWYENHLWALPIDAAAQVAAFRKDLLEHNQLNLPVTLDDMESMAEKLPGDKYIGIPLSPTDIWCTFLTLSAQYSRGTFFSENGINPVTGAQALQRIRTWIPFLHPESLDMNPIHMLDFMSEFDEVVYVPFIFSYSNYSRKAFPGKTVHFSNAPISEPSGISTLLGGVGIAISAQSEHIDEALSFIRFILSENIQKRLYYREGGQPAHSSVWNDKRINDDCNNYFINIRQTLDHAYVRPQIKGFNRFQEQAADLLNAAVRTDEQSGDIVEKINRLYQRICGGN